MVKRIITTMMQYKIVAVFIVNKFDCAFGIQ